MSGLTLSSVLGIERWQKFFTICFSFLLCEFPPSFTHTPCEAVAIELALLPVGTSANFLYLYTYR